MPDPHIDRSLSRGDSTSDLGNGLERQQRGAWVLELSKHMEELEEAPRSWLQTSPSLAIVAIRRGVQSMEDFFDSPSFCVTLPFK